MWPPQKTAWRCSLRSNSHTGRILKGWRAKSFAPEEQHIWALCEWEAGDQSICSAPLAKSLEEIEVSSSWWTCTLQAKFLKCATHIHPWTNCMFELWWTEMLENKVLPVCHLLESLLHVEGRYRFEILRELMVVMNYRTMSEKISGTWVGNDRSEMVRSTTQ